MEGKRDLKSKLGKRLTRKFYPQAFRDQMQE